MLLVAAAPRSRPPKTPVTRSSPTTSASPIARWPANALLNVIIVVPPSVGTLAVGGVPVASGTVIAANTISSHLLTYTPPANANGNGLANFSFRVQDGGGTANGGQDTAQAASTIGVNVTAVNDAPFFTLGQDQNTTDENPVTHGPALPQTVAGFAANLSAGPANESAQTLNFTVTNNNNGLFSVQPTIDASGKLTFTAKPNAHGTALVTVTLRDNGGLPAADSFQQQFNINISKPLIWHNSNVWTKKPQAPNTGFDVNGDGAVAANDALAVINYINAFVSTLGSKVPALGSTLPNGQTWATASRSATLTWTATASWLRTTPWRSSTSSTPAREAAAVKAKEARARVPAPQLLPTATSTTSADSELRQQRRSRR